MREKFLAIIADFEQQELVALLQEMIDKNEVPAERMQAVIDYVERDHDE